MKKQSVSHAERKALTRRALLDSAREVVAKRGMDAASVDEIAVNAGLTVGAIYSNFANKAELMIALLDDSSAQESIAAESLVASCASLLQALEALARETIDRADTQPEVFALGLEFMGYAIRDPDVRSRRIPMHVEHTRGLALQLEAVVSASGERLPMEQEAFAEAVGAMLWTLGMARTWLGPEVISESIVLDAVRQFGKS